MNSFYYLHMAQVSYSVSFNLFTDHWTYYSNSYAVKWWWIVKNNNMNAKKIAARSLGPDVEKVRRRKMTFLIVKTGKYLEIAMKIICWL